MDVTQLAQDVSAILIPFLPYLLPLGKKAAEGAAEKMGGDAWETAKTVWHRLRPSVEGKPSAKVAVEEAAKAPENNATLDFLHYQLQGVFEDDPQLAGDIASILQQARVRGDVKVGTVVASGEVTGVEAESLESGTVHGSVEADEVAGKVVGVSIKRIGGSGKG